ncbi:MAG TPA: hypothetical protein VLH19_00115 [Patescibacteria group bacterium]|nr:hypothetical protein [Patescibacteria group bacterium]
MGIENMAGDGVADGTELTALEKKNEGKSMGILALEKSLANGKNVEIPSLNLRILASGGSEKIDPNKD